MMRRLWLTSAIILFVLFQNGWSQSGDSTATQRLVLVHADLLQGQNIGGQQIRQLIGNVMFRQGDATLTCERAVQYLDEGKTLLSGGVAFIDTARSLFGDQVTYEEKARITYVEGNAKLVDSSRTLLSNRLQYHEAEEKAAADGDVVILDEHERSKIEGRHAEYDRKAGYAKVTGKPTMSRADSTGESELVIRGVIFEMFQDGETFVVSDSVHVQQGEIEAWCDTLIYLKKTNVIKLANAPRVRQNRQYLTGKSVSLLLKDNDVAGIEIIGNAIATSSVDSTVAVFTPYDLLTGERMMVYVADDKIDSVRITGRATSYYHVIEEHVEKGLNKALGDTLFIAFADEEIDRVRVTSSPGASLGEFHPPARQSVLDAELRLLLVRLGITLEEKKKSGEAVLTDERASTQK